MFSGASVDSSRSFADAENTRLQFVIVLHHVAVETNYSLVLTDRTTIQLFQSAVEGFDATFYEIFQKNDSAPPAGPT